MEEYQKDAIRLWTTNQHILHDLHTIQSELEIVRVHGIELEKDIMLQIINDKKV